jgi:2-keto-4-pentenoate hydratase/2-oxohepta-3-ene-1,7-dioic acid hydratase in catechol pathway
MTSEEFVRDLDARNQEVLHRLAPEATLKPEVEGDLNVLNLLKVALKNEIEAAEIAARWMVTTDEIRDPQVLDLWLDVNGRRMQTGNTRTMIFGVAKLVSYVSHYMTLLPGDIITTGTPPGVALGMKEPAWLKPGDVMTLGIRGLGEQRQKIVAWPG